MILHLLGWLLHKLYKSLITETNITVVKNKKIIIIKSKISIPYGFCHFFAQGFILLWVIT